MDSLVKDVIKVVPPPFHSLLEDRILLIEISGIKMMPGEILSKREASIFSGMSQKRRPSFYAARLALKTLYRRISKDAHIPPAKINTVDLNSRVPVIPDSRYFCSVSHDRRFCVAVACQGRVGIDVEKMDGRLLKNAAYYMSPAEKRLAGEFCGTQTEAAAMIWTSKEACAKAAGIGILTAIRRVEIESLGKEKSLVRFDAKKKFYALHDSVDDHLFSLVILGSNQKGEAP